MATPEELRRRARATWAAGDWDRFALWGVEAHARGMFTAAGASPSISRELVAFHFPSVEEAVRDYADGFGPFVMVRNVLEPQGRWDEFLAAFHDRVTRFNAAEDGRAEIESAYFLITVEP